MICPKAKGCRVPQQMCDHKKRHLLRAGCYGSICTLNKIGAAWGNTEKEKVGVACVSRVKA